MPAPHRRPALAVVIVAGRGRGVIEVVGVVLRIAIFCLSLNLCYMICNNFPHLYDRRLAAHVAEALCGAGPRYRGGAESGDIALIGEMFF